MQKRTPANWGDVFFCFQVPYLGDLGGARGISAAATVLLLGMEPKLGFCCWKRIERSTGNVERLRQPEEGPNQVER